ncbi:MAG: metal ABC transporter permease [Planctomycetota bacterium]
MIEFFSDMAVNPLLATGLVGGVLAGISCGLIGPYVVTRRIVFLAGAIAHIVVGGVGAVLWLRYQCAPALDWLQPLHGALVAALLAAFIIGLVQHYSRERLDTLIGALWAVGMAVGILLVKFTPGYHTEIMSYLFGNIAVVGQGDVILIGVLNVVILALALIFHKRLVAVCLDEEYARLQGISVLATNLLALSLVALTVVALIRVVGLILVIALLTLPAATAGHFTRRFGSLIASTVVLCVLLTTVPRVAVYGTRISPESAIVLSAAAVYFLSLAIRAAVRR